MAEPDSSLDIATGEIKVYALLALAKRFLMEARLIAYRTGEPPEATGLISTAYDAVHDCLDSREPV